MPSTGSTLIPETLIQIRPTEDDGTNSPEDQKNYEDYSYASGIYQRLIDAWGVVMAETERQRCIRYVKDADSIDLRASGLIKADEMYCPVRLVDSNIRAEQPSILAYITQSRRSIIFASPDAIPIDGIEKLEQDFTTKARYLQWEVPFIRCTDGSAAHGWDSLEVIFDIDAPGNFCFEHIGHDRLVFSTDCEELESQEVIGIKKNLTAKQLRAFVQKDGWNSAQVEALIAQSSKVAGVVNANCEVFKMYYKKNDIVYICWYGRYCSDYLKAPAQLFMGVRDIEAGKVRVNPDDPMDLTTDYPPMPETEYPIVIETYIESNDPRIIELSGRVKLDEASQEAVSAIQSGLVNGTLRAANIYASPKASNINSNPNAAPSQTNVVLANGAIYDQPLEFFHTPYPDPSVIQSLQTIVTQNKQEQGQINFSVLNRKDSGKTATEVQAANQASTELTSVQVILLSIFIRSCYAKAWRIYQNRVLQGGIVIRDPELLQLFGDNIQVDPATMRVIACEAPAFYTIKSSGDVDVIQRQEHLQKLLQGWPVFSKTSLADEYLKDIIRCSFPEDAERYIGVLDNAAASQVNQLKALLGQLALVVKALAVDPHTGQPRPDVAGEMPRLQQLEQQVANILGMPQDGQMAGQAGSGITNNAPQIAA